MRRRIFISYGSPDKAILKSLIKELSPHHDLWWDDELHKTVGQKWWDSILDEIEKADAILFLLSNDSLSSKYCIAEQEESKRLKKPILPILVRAKTNLPNDLKEMQILDVSDGIAKRHIDELLASLDNPQLYKPKVPSMRKERTPMPESKKETNWGNIIAAIGVIVAFLGVLVALAVPFIEKALEETSTPTVQTATLAPSPPTTQTPADTATSTNQTASTNTPIAPIITNTTTLSLHRSGDSIAVCANQDVDLSDLRFDFGNNLSYILGEVFPESSNTQAGDCWCLQKEDARFPLPSVCNSANTKELGRSQDDWRNPDVEIFLNNQQLGTCPAQADNRDVYSCPEITP